MVVGKLSMKEADIFKIWEFANIHFPFPHPLKTESTKIIYFEDIFTENVIHLGFFKYDYHITPERKIIWK